MNNNKIPEIKSEAAVTGAEKVQKRIRKYKRGGQVLSEDEVKRIKAGRKKLQREMKAAGIKSKKEFELNASNLGLYFDNPGTNGLALGLRGKALPIILGAASTLLVAGVAVSSVAKLQGHFTINLTDELFKAGFMLAENPGFDDPTSNLYSAPVPGAPCISITEIPADVDKIDGPHNGEDYFAYTFYMKYEGDVPSSYDYQLKLNSEGKSLSVASWVMLFEDSEMTFFAKGRDDGTSEAIPSIGDNSRGYTQAQLPFIDVTKDKSQYEEILRRNDVIFYRLLPKPFVTDIVISEGKRENVQQGEVHKYTIVIWLEGDDPDCTNDLIGGHIGLEMDIRLLEEE